MSSTHIFHHFLKENNFCDFQFASLFLKEPFLMEECVHLEQPFP